MISRAVNATTAGAGTAECCKLKVRLPQNGPVAQLGARLNGIQEVTSSILVRSTNSIFVSETESK
jgi:hypothetical protein